MWNTDDGTEQYDRNLFFFSISCAKQPYCMILLYSLPTQVKRVEALYWKVEDPEAFSSDVFPTTFGFANGIGIYGIPVEEYPGMVKVLYVVYIDINTYE